MIPRLFRWLFGVCEHDYREIETSRVSHYYRILYRCEKCGKHKCRTL